MDSDIDGKEPFDSDVDFDTDRGKGVTRTNSASHALDPNPLLLSEMKSFGTWTSHTWTSHTDLSHGPLTHPLISVIGISLLASFFLLSFPAVFIIREGDQKVLTLAHHHARAVHTHYSDTRFQESRF